MKCMSVIRLMVEANEIPEELERYCVEHLADCFAVDVFSFGDFDEDALQRAKDSKPEGMVHKDEDSYIITAYVIQIFETGNNGDFLNMEDVNYEW